MEISKRKIDWEEILDQWQKTRQPVSSLCKELEVSKASFYYWRRRLGLRGHNKNHKKKNFISPKATFVPVQLCRENNNHLEAEIKLYYPNGCYLRLTEACNPKLLRMVNEMMGGKTC